MIVLKRILVATDFSDGVRKRAGLRRRSARAYGATLHLLHVAEDVLMSIGPEVGFAVPELQADLERRARQSLEKLILEHNLESLDTVPAVETATNAAAAIVELRNASADRYDHWR